MRVLPVSGASSLARDSRAINIHGRNQLFFDRRTRERATRRK